MVVVVVVVLEHLKQLQNSPRDATAVIYGTANRRWERDRQTTSIQPSVLTLVTGLP